jgi:hypothetical protein
MNLAYLHGRLPNSQDVLLGLDEIGEALAEERKARAFARHSLGIEASSFIWSFGRVFDLFTSYGVG